MVLPTGGPERDEDQGKRGCHQDGEQVFHAREWLEPSERIRPNHQDNYNSRENSIYRITLTGAACASICQVLSGYNEVRGKDKGIILWMTDFHFYHLIEVRYGDLDPQGHVNNAKFLTYIEQARVFYLKQLKLWEGGSFMNMGVILADIQLTFHKAIEFGDQVRAGVRVSRLGNKSMTAEYRLEDVRDESLYATGTSVLVAYDYHARRSVSIPMAWRKAIRQFENLSE